MADKNNSSQPGTGLLKPFIIAVIIIVVAWIIGKGVLTLVSSVKKI